MPVMRFLLRLSLISVPVLALPMLLIRAQPYDDSQLRAFLTPPESCPVPCFLGIRPGVTTVEAAVTMLQAHEWIQEVFIESYGIVKPRQIGWHWSRVAPAIVQGDGLRRGGRLGVDGQGIVEYMQFRTQVKLGDALLRWGAPDQYTTLVQTGGPVGGPVPPKPITYIYDDMILVGWTQCPYFRNLREANTDIILGEPEAWLETALTYPFVSGVTPVHHFIHDIAPNLCPRRQ